MPLLNSKHYIDPDRHVWWLRCPEESFEPMQAKVEARNKKIRDMVGVACTKGKSKGSHVRPLQALNLVDDGCERVSAPTQVVIHTDTSRFCLHAYDVTEMHYLDDCHEGCSEM